MKKRNERIDVRKNGTAMLGSEMWEAILTKKLRWSPP
jgi:hypothetical protein